MEPLIVVSADGHAGCPVEGYRQYIEPKYQHLMPELLEDEKGHHMVKQLFGFLNDPERLAAVDTRNRIGSGGYTGGWDAERRMKELDAEGIAAEVLFPGVAEALTPFFYQFNRPYPADIRMAGIRAYHRWLADMIAPSKGRLIGTAVPGPATKLDATIEELSYLAGRGFRGVFVPGWLNETGTPRLYDKHFEPFWAACSDLQLVLTIHVGWGTAQGQLIEIVAKLKELRESGGASESFETAMRDIMSRLDENNPNSMFAMDLGPRQALWQLIFSGIFDRYPNLKLSVAECRADWVPGLKTHLDQQFLTAKRRPNLKMKPSEYFGRNVFITPSSPRRMEVEQRHEIGLDNFLFGADFPHPEATWPNTLAWLRAIFFDVPEQELRAILGENAIKVYGLDKAWLAGIAAKIGPKPSDIIGDYKVDQRIIEDFNQRSNFATDASTVFEKQLLDRKVNDDMSAAAA